MFGLDMGGIAFVEGNFVLTVCYRCRDFDVFLGRGIPKRAILSRGEEGDLIKSGVITTTIHAANDRI